MNKGAYGRYSYSLTYSEADGGRWHIYEGGEFDGKIVFECAHDDKDELYPPQKLRDEYERLIEWKPGDLTGDPFNIVEVVSKGACAFDQPCQFGHRVENHAVYCHNTSWLYAPRKCRRTWYTGGAERDEDCEGYSPNPRKSA